MISGNQDILQTRQTSQKSQPPVSFYVSTTSELERYTSGFFVAFHSKGRSPENSIPVL